MIVSENVRLASSVAFLLVSIFGWPLVELFPPSTAGRVLSLLFVTIVGVGSLYISIFAKTEEDRPLRLSEGGEGSMKRKTITIEVTAEEVDALEDIYFVKLSEERRKELDDAKLSFWKKVATAFDCEEGR